MPAPSLRFPPGPVHPALRRVLRLPGAAEAFALLAERLPGRDLTTFLLEVFRRRTGQLTPAEVARRYRADRFVSPAPTDARALRRAEDELIAALPPGFELLVLAPVVPLGTHTAVAPVDPRKVIATVRGHEVAADPTNGLALEAVVRRARLLAADRRSAEPVRLAASQRVTRAQRSDGPGALAHFQLFGAVTAGRDAGDRAFERQHLVEHLRFAADAALAAGASLVEVRLTCLDPALEAAAADATGALVRLPGVRARPYRERESGRGYYTGLCYQVGADLGGGLLEVGDGGFVDWSQRLAANRKERLLITGLGVDRLCAPAPPAR